MICKAVTHSSALRRLVWKFPVGSSGLLQVRCQTSLVMQEAQAAQAERRLLEEFNCPAKIGHQGGGSGEGFFHWWPH